MGCLVCENEAIYEYETISYTVGLQGSETLSFIAFSPVFICLVAYWYFYCDSAYSEIENSVNSTLVFKLFKCTCLYK